MVLGGRGSGVVDTTRNPFTVLPFVFLSVDMIPENALEEMTKNMDPNLVIVEAKEGVQMK